MSFLSLLHFFFFFFFFFFKEISFLKVAETFAFEDAEGVALNNWTRLDTLVTVVDSINFMPTMATTANVQVGCCCCCGCGILGFFLWESRLRFFFETRLDGLFLCMVGSFLFLFSFFFEISLFLCFFFSSPQDSEDGGVGEEDFRSLSALLVDQVEFADVILLNKVDLMKEEDLIKIEGILKNMNPVAKVIR